MRAVALLYSITLGDGARLVMADWQAMLEGMGFTNVRTLIATGNAVFETAKMPIARLETKLEEAFEARFGRRIPTLVRDADAWRALAAANPFPREAAKDGTKVFVRVGRAAIPSAGMERLAGLRAKGEALAQNGAELWVKFPGASASSRLVSAVSRLREPVGTLRNWNTVRRIATMLNEG